MWLLVDTLWDCLQVSGMQLARMQLTHVTMATHWLGEPTQGSVWRMVPGLDLVLSVTLSVSMECNSPRSGLQVIKLELILKLKIKRNDWLQPIIALYYEPETVLTFYNLEARSDKNEYLFKYG